MNIDSIFSPKSVALIGASRDERSVGFSIFKNLVTSSYTGNIFGVNPRADTLLEKKIFHDVRELPEIPELAIIAIPSPFVVEQVRLLATIGVRSIIIVSAGFKETGTEGKYREQEIVNICTKYHISLVGPNCLGVVNPHSGLNASFETVIPRAGTLAFVSQSGALISSLLDIATKRELGFSKVISVGNKAMIGEHELLPYLFSDPFTKVILLYAESLTDAKRLIHLVRTNNASEHPKPIILLKAGVTSAGQRASSSHTGSLAGSDVAYQALVEQAGIIRVKTMNEMLSAAAVFATGRLPKSRNIAIVTNAGGPGIIATDEADRIGLTLANLGEKTQESLQTILPKGAHIENPTDILGDAMSDRYEQTLQAIVKDDAVESVVTIVTPQSMTDIPQTAEAIVRVKESTNKLIAASFIGEPLVKPGIDILAAHDVPHAQFPEDAIQAVGHAVHFYEITKKTYGSHHLPSIDIPNDVFSLIASLQDHRVHLVNLETTWSILQQCGFPMVTSKLAQSREEAEAIAKMFHGRVAMKIVSPDISHKTDFGGVRLNVHQEDVGRVFEEILEAARFNAPNAKTHGILISEMIEDEGEELILGIQREQHLGTMMMLGAGGIYVELLRDVVFRFIPLTDQDIDEMIESLRIKPLLYGFRGSRKKDLNVLRDIIIKLSYLALQIPAIESIDINPFLLREDGKGGVILDARIVLESIT